ncbi:MAG: hypothetical protein J5762_04230 [Clostridia bacterium]|nr:hypothetical protein [Clostridia bacterium]
MESKKMSIKWMLILGIIIAVTGFFSLIVHAIAGGGSESTSTTIVHTQNSTSVYHSSFDLLVVGYFLELIVGTLLIALYVIWKKDYIKICEDRVELISIRKERVAKFEEIESCSSSNSAVFIKLKNEQKAIRITFVKNAYEIAKYLNEKLALE